MLAAWSLQVPQTTCTVITAGHINRTLLVETGEHRFVLQRLSPIFAPEVDEDIEAVTARLAAAGLLTPRLVRTCDGRLHHLDPATGAVWRLLTHVDGESLQRADSPERCREAGALLGRFHRALWGSDHVFRHRRLGVHDTVSHLARLRQALDDHRDHRLYRAIAAEGREILAVAAGLSLPAALPVRVVHGDPKISNVIFGPDGEARCLVDLDTLDRMPLAVELGDALRSWCSPLGEEQPGPFELDFFRAGLGGWAAAIGALPTLPELAAIPETVEVIALELAARFCRDALQESYFGWDPARHGSAAEHNLARCRSQLHLARQVRRHLPRMRTIAHALW